MDYNLKLVDHGIVIPDRSLMLPKMGVGMWIFTRKAHKLSAIKIKHSNWSTCTALICDWLIKVKPMYELSCWLVHGWENIEKTKIIKTNLKVLENKISKVELLLLLLVRQLQPEHYRRLKVTESQFLNISFTSTSI